MSELKEIQRKIAKRLYELFVVNRNAMAVQLADGNYATKYTKITEMMFYACWPRVRQLEAISNYIRAHTLNGYVLISIVKTKKSLILKNCISLALGL